MKDPLFTYPELLAITLGGIGLGIVLVVLLLILPALALGSP
jgi:hypothetical protein